MSLTTDKNNPDLGYGSDDKPGPQNKVYLVLSPEEIKQGYIRPLRLTYTHLVCNTNTTMDKTIAATYAVNPSFYGATYCCYCRMHKPVGEHGEFVWAGTTAKVGT